MWGLDVLEGARVKIEEMSLGASESLVEARGVRVMGEAVSERDWVRISNGSEVTFELEGVLERKRGIDNLSRKLDCGDVNARDVDDMEACARALVCLMLARIA